ncbi:hypothetical protein EJ05DRAFT_394133 [Pseudovirgaria hyperparasitica]|uniref:Uncharacterized protein n=1 Tax=Pseudovirgaria hyperparasitica TaxID=470096 RepID=A0A6A6W4S2_9PEZI|nr:uncharacterized protein EJ05DRAFT_394133 [Pseudovirgaria hyperparasitica]KAF2757555.1 hypothetical protein EJ05DRAFT_394133 [Pseudovirgaria hyperparasitica]
MWVWRRTLRQWAVWRGPCGVLPLASHHLMMAFGGSSLVHDRFWWARVVLQGMALLNMCRYHAPLQGCYNGN